MLSSQATPEARVIELTRLGLLACFVVFSMPSAVDCGLTVEAVAGLSPGSALGTALKHEVFVVKRFVGHILIVGYEEKKGSVGVAGPFFCARI